MAKKQTTPPAPDGPATLKYIGPPDAESARYGALVPGRCYQEADGVFADYLVTTHPETWARA